MDTGGVGQAPVWCMTVSLPKVSSSCESYILMCLEELHVVDIFTMSEKTFDDVDFDLFKFLSKHCLPRAPSDLDIPEWAATRDFLMSPSPSFDLSKFGSFVSPADMLSDSDISAHSFNPCEGWSVSNNTPYEERFPMAFDHIPWISSTRPVFKKTGTQFQFHPRFQSRSCLVHLFLQTTLPWMALARPQSGSFLVVSVRV